MNDDTQKVERDTGTLGLLGYVLLWLVGNVMLILFIISCWKFGPLTKRGDIIFFALLHFAVLVGIHKLHKKYYGFVRKFFNNIGL